MRCLKWVEEPKLGANIVAIYACVPMSLLLFFCHLLFAPSLFSISVYLLDLRSLPGSDDRVCKEQVQGFCISRILQESGIATARRQVLLVEASQQPGTPFCQLIWNSMSSRGLYVCILDECGSISEGLATCQNGQYAIGHKDSS